MYNICKSNDIPCPFIEKYINDRENILQEVILEYNVSRSNAKTLFIRLAFFGTFYGWANELKISKKKIYLLNILVKNLVLLQKN